MQFLTKISDNSQHLIVFDIALRLSVSLKMSKISKYFKSFIMTTLIPTVFCAAILV